ncbi:MAG: HEAT repeat domain-containing protein [Spirochaetales bacterium]
MKKSLPLLYGLLMAPVFLFAQSTDKAGPKTVEDVYLQSSVEVQVVRSLVNEQGRSEKIKALDFIAKMVETGKVNDKSVDVIVLLDQLGGEGTTSEIRQNGRVINDYPEVRRQAAELLGQIGGDKAREVLLNMAIKDPEPMVISEAVYSLGLIGGGDQSARVESVITNLVKSQDAIRPDSNFAFAAVSSLEMLGKKNNGRVSQEVFAALIKIQNGNYITPVRKKAESVLAAFTKY